MVIYFGKVNLCSEHIYEIMDGNEELRKILSKLEVAINNDLSYDYEGYEKVDDSVEKELVTTHYEMHVTGRNAGYVRGHIVKDETIHYKKYNKATKKLDFKSVKSNEAVDFYFDIYNEMVGYNTANRFGYVEFLTVFGGLLNKSMEEAKLPYVFSVGQYCEGIDIDELYKELASIDSIKELTFKFQPPNGMFGDIKKIQDGVDNYVEEYKDANLSAKVVTLTSNSRSGINIKSREVSKLIKETSLNGTISTSESTKYGYVSVNAKDYHGNKFSSEKKKPVKKEIGDIIEFEEACRNVILAKNKRELEQNH